MYKINPERNAPWNELPNLPIDEPIYRTTDIYEKLGNAKEATR